MSTESQKGAAAFVAEIMHVGKMNIAVVFLKKSLKGNFFVMESPPTKHTVVRENILKVLPKPVTQGGTKRRQAMLCFKADLASFCL